MVQDFICTLHFKLGECKLPLNVRPTDTTWSRAGAAPLVNVGAGAGSGHVRVQWIVALCTSLDKQGL